jgi:hypothetical protein
MNTGGAGSSVGIVTSYGLDGPGIECRWGRDFPHLSRPALGPSQPPVQWVPGLSRGKDWPGRDADLSPPSSAVVMEGWSYTSTPSLGRKACTEPQCLYKGELYFLHNHCIARRYVILPPTPFRLQVQYSFVACHLDSHKLINPNGDASGKVGYYELQPDYANNPIKVQVTRLYAAWTNLFIDIAQFACILQYFGLRNQFRSSTEV